MSRQSIQVAEQGTLEAVLDAVEELGTAVQDLQSRPNSAHLAWLTDYKLFGEESYVFNNKDVLHELYKDYDLVMNDNRINAEAFDWIVTAAESGQAHVGQALASIHGMSETETLRGLQTIGAVINNNTTMDAVCNNNTAISVVLYTSLDIIEQNNNALNSIINSSNGSIKYLAITNGYDASKYNDLNSFISDYSLIETICDNSSSMYILSNSSYIMNGIIANNTALSLIITHSTSINAISISTTGSNILMSSSNARNLLLENNSSLSIVYSNEIGCVKYIIGSCGGDCANYNNANQFILDSELFSSALNDLNTAKAIVSCPAIMYEITKYESNKTIFNRSSVIKGNKDTRTTITSIAYTALANSSLFEKYDGSTSGIGYSTIYVNKSNLTGVTTELDPDDCIVINRYGHSQTYYGDSYISGKVYDLYGNIMGYATNESYAKSPYIAFGGIKAENVASASLDIFVPKTV